MRGLVFNFIPQCAVANQQQPRLRYLRQDYLERASRSAWPLSLNNRAIFADDEMAFVGPNCLRNARSFVAFKKTVPREALKMACTFPDGPIPAAR